MKKRALAPTLFVVGVTSAYVLFKLLRRPAVKQALAKSFNRACVDVDQKSGCAALQEY